MARTLEQLENDIWPEPDVHTSLIDACYRLRRVPIDRLSAGDIRLLLGQRIGVCHLVPLAINLLDGDPLLDTSYSPGDLLAAVLRADDKRFRGFPKLRSQLVVLASRARQMRLESDEMPLLHDELSLLLSEYERQ